MTVHAELGPSSSDRWTTCYGSVALSRGIKDVGSSNASEGTMMHAFSARCLETATYAKAYIGEKDAETGLTLSEEQAKDVQTYVDYVWDIVEATKGTLLVEQRLPIAWMTNEDGAVGTADAIIITPDELIVVDAKFGFKMVDAVENKQLMMYAAAAYDEHKIAYDFKSIRVAIVQPRLNATPEWTTTPDALMAFAAEIAFAAEQIQSGNDNLVPSEKGCQWCRAKAICPAIKAKVMNDFETVVPETADEDDLARVMVNANLIESWVKSIRAEVERRLLAGEPVKGYKLVQGKRGNRQWADADDAEATLKSMRIKHAQMYDYKLASPTSIEKLVKAEEIGPRQWVKIQDLITQSEGTPSVAPETDKRPALSATANLSDFD